MGQVLLIAQHDGARLDAATTRALSCAASLGEVTVAVFAGNAADIAAEAAALAGVARVWTVESATGAHPLAAVLAPQIAELAQGFTHVLLPSTTFGKDVAPRVAALLGAPQLSDVMEVVDERTFKRPIYAGNVIITARVPDGTAVVATVRTASYKAAAGGSGPAPVEARAVNAAIPDHTRYIGEEIQGGERPDLQSAPRVVSGGRGVGSEENFRIIYELADKLGAAVGASRAAVDAGFVPNDTQVGQTGKIIAPELYFAIGISGQIQHLTGIKDAGTIVAINKDGDAPIFEIADIGLVGDLFEIIPELSKALDKL